MREPWKQRYTEKTPCNQCGSREYDQPFKFFKGDPYCTKQCWDNYIEHNAHRND